MARDQTQRSKADRVERLRKRLETLGNMDPMVPIIKGILDLLADEL